MRFFSVAAVLVASASSASAVLYGCFPRTALNIATLNNTSPTQYAGPCSGLCGQERKPVTILADGTKCYCAPAPLPDRSTQLPDSQCDIVCPGYDRQRCGGTNGAVTIYTTN